MTIPLAHNTLAICHIVSSFQALQLILFDKFYILYFEFCLALAKYAFIKQSVIIRLLSILIKFCTCNYIALIK